MEKGKIDGCRKARRSYFQFHLFFIG